MRLALVWVVVATGCATAPPAKDVETNVLVSASTDAAALAQLFQHDVVNGGLWFEDPDCLRQFPVAAEIHDDKIAAFAKCVSALHLQPSTRKDPLGDVIVMTYPPGIEIEARVVPDTNGWHLSWIGYESRRDNADALPTISPAILETLRIAGDHNGPVGPETAAKLDLDPQTHDTWTWLKVCVDADGAVTSSHVREAASPNNARAFAAAVATWKFRPFTISGHALPVCAMERLVYPPAPPPAHELLPPALPRSANAQPDQEGPFVLSPRAVETKRIAGDKLVAPSALTKAEIQSSGNSRIRGAFRFCIDTAGKVASIELIRSTGFPSYDHKIANSIKHWAYSPFLDDDRPISVCTAVTFIYSQR